MNTYLDSKPSFTSPQPLAAASGLTIPLQITLSEIKLSGFIILVFSKQKGLTLVFRNDPLESLKVSSTFDSIQFVRDYLQRTIEGKLRDLIQDELPAIIHRLSLQLWCPDQVPKDNSNLPYEESESLVDPLAGPPVDPVDAHGNLLDVNDIASMSVDGAAEVQSLFSQKNLIRLAALSNSHRTLSLYTPSIPQAVFRAWAGPMDRQDSLSSPPFSTPSLVKSYSYAGTPASYASSEASSHERGTLPSRPSLVSLHSATTGLSLGANRSKSYTGRKKKNRVVNLRKNRTASETNSEAGETISDTTSEQAPMSEPILPAAIPEEPEETTLVGTMSTRSRVHFETGDDKAALPSRPRLNMDMYNAPDTKPTAQAGSSKAESGDYFGESHPTEAPALMSKLEADMGYRRDASSDTSSVILEQAWISKMAGEIARRVYEEKQRNPHFWEDREDVPPPAYEASR